MSGSPAITELISCLPYDYIVLDLEHGSDQPYQLPNLLRCIEAHNTIAVVRMPSHDPIAIKQALDNGVTNFLFPFVQTTEQAKAIADAAYYPPTGKRGFAMMHRASKFATTDNYFNNSTQEITLFAQLETQAALNIGTQIATVEGITGAFIGPGDLSVDLGQPGNTQHPTVKQAMEQFANQCKQQHILLGTVVGTPAQATWALNAGFNYVSIGNDLINIKNKSLEQLQELKNNQKP